MSAIIFREGKSTRNDQSSQGTFTLITLTSVDVWAMGISIVIGGQYYQWNAGLAAGFGSYAICMGLMSVLYLCLCRCNAELSSSIPFAGGAYGLARLSLGLFPGFLIGCCEALEFIVYVADASVSFSRLIVSCTGTSDSKLPLYSAVFYLSALAIHIRGGRFFWNINLMLALVSFFVIIVYILGALPSVDFARYAPLITTAEPLSSEDSISTSPTAPDGSKAWFIGGMHEWMRVYPLSAWFYIGVESLNFCSIFVNEPTVIIPRGSLACIYSLVATTICVMFVCCSLKPGSGVLATSLAPLNYGFSQMFNMSSRWATVLSLPAAYATAFGFMFSYSRVIQAMARSGLFPSSLAKTFGPNHTPTNALLVGSVIGYSFALVVCFFPGLERTIFNVCAISAFSAYISQFIGFIVFRKEFADHKRGYHNPFGLQQAVLGMLLSLLGVISIIGFQNDPYHTAVVIFVLAILIMVAYYFAYAKARQSFSPEEQVIFRKQIALFNERARQRMLHGTEPHGSELPAFHRLSALKSSVRVSLKRGGSNSSNIMKDIIDNLPAAPNVGPILGSWLDPENSNRSKEDVPRFSMGVGKLGQLWKKSRGGRSSKDVSSVVFHHKSGGGVVGGLHHIGQSQDNLLGRECYGNQGLDDSAHNSVQFEGSVDSAQAHNHHAMPSFRKILPQGEMFYIPPQRRSQSMDSAPEQNGVTGAAHRFHGGTVFPSEINGSIAGLDGSIHGSVHGSVGEGSMLSPTFTVGADSLSQVHDGRGHSQYQQSRTPLRISPSNSTTRMRGSSNARVAPEATTDHTIGHTAHAQPHAHLTVEDYRGHESVRPAEYLSGLVSASSLAKRNSWVMPRSKLGYEDPKGTTDSTLMQGAKAKVDAVVDDHDATRRRRSWPFPINDNLRKTSETIEDGECNDDYFLAPCHGESRHVPMQFINRNDPRYSQERDRTDGHLLDPMDEKIRQMLEMDDDASSKSAGRKSPKHTAASVVSMKLTVSDAVDDDVAATAEFGTAANTGVKSRATMETGAETTKTPLEHSVHQTQRDSASPNSGSVAMLQRHSHDGAPEESEIFTFVKRVAHLIDTHESSSMTDNEGTAAHRDPRRPHNKTVSHIQGDGVYSSDASSDDEKDDPWDRDDNIRIRSRFSSVDIPADRDPLEFLNSQEVSKCIAGKIPQKGHLNPREEK